jgi:hypothetical protein
MSMLKGLTFTTAPRAASLVSPQEFRRSKLVAHLQEQRDIAVAEGEGREHIATRRRWQLTETGEKQRVEVQKRLRRWWMTDADGKVLLTLRWGTRLLELQKDKSAIVVGDRSKLVGVLEKLVAAAKAGELDAAVEQANSARAVSRRKAA